MGQKKQTKFIIGKREFGKILMCLIIAIIMLTSLKAIATTIIAGSAEVIEDEKTIVRTAAAVSRGASSSNKVELASLRTELGRYASTTVTEISSEMIQVKFNRTGNIYEINENVGPTFDATGTIPYLPAGYIPVEGTDLETGFVIEDKDGNQFVWVEVPRTSAVYPTAGTNITHFTSEDYDKIINDLKSYTSAYTATTDRDIYYSDEATGLTETEYNKQKKKMLKSIYKNGGFYIGRYETGIDYSEGPRTASGNTSQTPVIKKNAYPYIYVTVPQSQQLSESFATTGYTTSLIFDVQWDLTMKYLENKGTTQDELVVDSMAWGNYRDNLYNITNASAKYSTDYGDTWSSAPYNKESATIVLLTTGASDTFCKQNIYDLAGNEYEWTLGVNVNSVENIQRGNYYGTSTVAYAAAVYASAAFGTSTYTKGFRVALYKDETDNTRTPTYIPEGYTHIAGNMDEGYVIADGNGNEFVWVEVPRTAEVYPTAGLNITTFTSVAYDKIEADLHTYTSVYGDASTHGDGWTSQAATGLTESEYNTQKKKMLKSIYKNGGFYVGRYETGIEDSHRYYDSDEYQVEKPITETPVIKANAYPYTYVRSAQAQTLSESFATDGYISSLMFGMQWDLMLKYLEVKGTPQAELNSYSTWGNNIDSIYNITNTNAKYAVDAVSLNVWNSAPYQKTESSKILLTTGANESFCKQNIYDIAGNVLEWTLETTSGTGASNAIGGSFIYDEWKNANHRLALSYIESYGDLGFRVALYKDEDIDEDILEKRIYDASNLDGNGTTGIATTTLKDLSGYHDATIYGNPTFGNGYISLNEGSSSNVQYIDMGPIHDLSKVTVNCKFSISEIRNEDQNIISNTQLGGFGLYINASGKIGFAVYREGGSDYETAFSTTTVALNTIYDVTGVYDGKYVYIYINGVLESRIETIGGNIKNPQNGEHTLIGTSPAQTVGEETYITKMKLYSASVTSNVEHPEEVARTYTITFDANGGAWSDGSTTKTIIVNAGDSIGLIATPSKSGTYFYEWSTTGGNYNSQAIRYVVPTGNMTFFATYYYNHGSGDSTAKVNDYNILKTLQIPRSIMLATPIILNKPFWMW